MRSLCIHVNTTLWYMYILWICIYATARLAAENMGRATTQQRARACVLQSRIGNVACHIIHRVQHTRDGLWLAPRFKCGKTPSPQKIRTERRRYTRVISLSKHKYQPSCLDDTIESINFTQLHKMKSTHTHTHTLTSALAPHLERVSKSIFTESDPSG